MRSPVWAFNRGSKPAPYFHTKECRPSYRLLSHCLVIPPRLQRYTDSRMGTHPLFDEPTNFDRVKLAEKLRALAQQGVFIGGSSWKYEGWLGQIYTPERYYSRGRFSQKRFEETCLQEYAETFPIVCGDFSFY